MLGSAAVLAAFVVVETVLALAFAVGVGPARARRLVERDVARVQVELLAEIDARLLVVQDAVAAHVVESLDATRATLAQSQSEMLTALQNNLAQHIVETLQGAKYAGMGVASGAAREAKAARLAIAEAEATAEYGDIVALAAQFVPEGNYQKLLLAGPAGWAAIKKIAERFGGVNHGAAKSSGAW